MPRIEPEESDFDPDALEPGSIEGFLREGIELFNSGQHHAAHEAFEKAWLSSEAGDAEFFKGLVQASICLHHLGRSNLEGAAKLYRGHRRLLAAYLPVHRSVQVQDFLLSMKSYLLPQIRSGSADAGGLGLPKIQLQT